MGNHFEKFPRSLDSNFHILLGSECLKIVLNRGLVLIIISLEEEEQEEDEEEAGKVNLILENLFKKTIECASNAHSDKNKNHLTSIIAGILVDGEVEDFLLIDQLLQYFIPSNVKLNPEAAKIVRGALQMCDESFAQILQSFLNTFFLEQDRAQSCRVAAKWTDVVLEVFLAKPELVSPSLPVIEERMDQSLAKATERMKTVHLLASFIIKG